MVPVLFIALALSAPEAGPAPEAKRLAHDSMLEYDAGDFERALAAITRAYELDPRPALLFNLGQVHRALGHWKEAEFFYRRYLAREPKAENREQVLKFIAEMQRQQRPVATPPTSTSVLVLAPAETPNAAPATAPPAAAPPVPVEAVTLAPAPVKRSRTLSLALGSAGLAAGLVAIYGGLQVSSFQATVARERANPGSVSWTTLHGEQQAAATWPVASILLGVAALAGLTTAAVTW